MIMGLASLAATKGGGLGEPSGSPSSMAHGVFD